MIICHKYRFIFIKTRKTASSSVEIGLSRVCGPEDVITTLSEKSGDEELRRAEGGQPPCNWQKAIREHRGLREWKRLLLRGERAQRFNPHMTAEALRRRIPADIFDGYHKISLERDPWDRAVSRYFWQKHRWERGGKSDFPSLSEFLRFVERDKPHWLSNWSHYTINDRIAVDRVMLYEKLPAELDALATDLAIDGNIALPGKRAKGGFRKARQHYSELLSDSDRALVGRVCAPEIEAFGYTFQGA